MSETLLGLMKKGGGSDFLGDNQYMVLTGAKATGSNQNAVINTYSVGAEIKNTFGASCQGFLVNVKGHSSAQVTTGSVKDGAFLYTGGVVTTVISETTETATGTFNIDVSSADYLIFIANGYSNRKIIITN